MPSAIQLPEAVSGPVLEDYLNRTCSNVMSESLTEAFSACQLAVGSPQILA